MKKIKSLENKILSLTEVRKTAAQWKTEGKKIVFTNGCFDILHYGHLDYLAGSSELGDRLVIGLNTDASVQKLKGPDRPVNNEMTRAMVLACMEFVDAIVLFDEPTPLTLIEAVNPDVLVKGGDYEARAVVGYDFVTQNGGEVRILPFVDGYSTTAVIKKIRKSAC